MNGRTAVLRSAIACLAVAICTYLGPLTTAHSQTTSWALTFVCTPLQDSHATDLGYEVIARQIWAASDYDRLRPEGGNPF